MSIIVINQQTTSFAASTDVSFSKIECGGCGIPYFVPSKWMKNKVDENGSFSCPNGCSRVFTGETADQKRERLLKEQKEKHERELSKVTDQLLDEINKRKESDLKLKRVSKGVCPCCNRTFANLQRHMNTKHPDHSKN